MCLSKHHLDFLERADARDLAQGRASSESHGRFAELAARCRCCARFDNRRFGDVQDLCRQDFLRLFIAMKGDADRWAALRRQAGTGGAGRSEPDRGEPQ